ncbi:MAG: hypothetical protein JWQ57_2402, partial [Mucilaginibacter sp.]|nr:hypothetical protein [Mucilaginibacter sp.]
MKKRIDDLKGTFIAYSEEKQRSVKGGTGPVVEAGLTDQQLQSMFNYAGFAPTGETGSQAQTDGFNSSAGKEWNTVIQEMYATSMGKSVLDALLAKE